MPLLFATSEILPESPSNLPFISILERSSSCPRPISAAAFAPSDRISSSSFELRLWPLFPDSPAGILAFSRFPNSLLPLPDFFLVRCFKSSIPRSIEQSLTPQLMSNPTPPGEITPPLSMSVATTPPIGKPNPWWKSAMPQASPTMPGRDAVLVSCSRDLSSLFPTWLLSETITASTSISPRFFILIRESPSSSRNRAQSSINPAGKCFPFNTPGPFRALTSRPVVQWSGRGRRSELRRGGYSLLVRIGACLQEMFCDWCQILD